MEAVENPINKDHAVIVQISCLTVAYKSLRLKSLKFPRVFRRKLDLLKKLIEIFTLLVYGLISVSNTYVNM